jgi:hypothetical protein
MTARIWTRALFAGAMLAAATSPAVAQSLPGGTILAKASDSALTKLAQPGTFLGDDAVRIALPGPLRKASGLMKLADQSGATKGLSKSINDAAGLAANEAKPIFRAAISRMNVSDGLGALKTGDGGTRYLRQSASPELREKIRPLILAALGRTGAFAQLDKLGSGASLLGGAGISRDGLTDSVADQTLSGIFKYMGTEETRMRANPIGMGKKLLGGF